MSGSGSIVVLGFKKLNASVALSSAGSIVVLGFKKLNANVALSGSGVLTSVAGFKFISAFAKSGAGSFAAAPRYIAQGIFGYVESTPARITEAGDSRITESGDTRTIEEMNQNSGVGSFVVQPTYTIFTSSVFAKVGVNWKSSEIYANVNGQWTIPEKVYQHINGGWKRIN